MMLNSDNLMRLQIDLLASIVTIPAVIIILVIGNEWAGMTLEWSPSWLWQWSPWLDWANQHDFLGFRTGIAVGYTTTVSAGLIYCYLPQYQHWVRQKNLIVTELLLALIISVGLYFYFKADYGSILLWFDSSLQQMVINGIIGMFIIQAIRAYSVLHFNDPYR